MNETVQPHAKANSRRKARRIVPRLSQALLAVMAIALAAGLVGFVLFSAEVSQLRKSDPAAAADGIVVLTGGKARIETALDLLGRGQGRRLLISGVHPRTSADAIRRAVGGDRRLFGCCIDIDRAALDTFGNAEQAGKWAHRNGFDSLIVVTSDYHMPRSLMEMRRTNPDIEMVPHLVPSETEGESHWASSPEHIRLIASEYLKYVAAVIRVRLDGRSTQTAVASARSM